jgi:hypothetical protein
MNPNFLIIGAARSGTTALTHFFKQHPQIFMCEPKEPHFMAFANREVNFRGPGDESLMNRITVTTLEGYQKLFATAQNKVAIGEGSVSTLYYHDQSIPNIKRYAPDAKLIVILRDPVERAFSSFMYMTSRGLEPLKEFEAALDNEERRISENWHHIWHYVRMGHYAPQIAAFQKAFDNSQIRYYLLEDLQADPRTLLKDVFQFLGVDDTFQPETDREINRSGNPKNRQVQMALGLLGRTVTLKRAIKAVIPARIREKIKAANLEHPEISKDARVRLSRLYQDDIKAVEDLLGRNLSVWK